MVYMRNFFDICVWRYVLPISPRDTAEMPSTTIQAATKHYQTLAFSKLLIPGPNFRQLYNNCSVVGCQLLASINNQ